MEKRTRLSSYTKIVLAVSAFLFLVDALLGSVLAIRTVDRMKKVIQGKILEIALSAANLLNGDHLEVLTYEDEQNQTDIYMESYNILKAFKTSSIDDNAELAYIYCIVERDNKYVFSVDPSDDPGEFLAEETTTTAALVAAFDGNPGFDEESYVDRWGDLLSAYAPVFGSDGKVKAVVGVDVWAEWYHKEIYSSAILIGGIMLFTIALGIASTVFIVKKVRKKIDALSLEMSDLETDVNELLAEIKIPDKEVMVEDESSEDSQKDHLNVLRKQINYTRKELKNYLDYTHQQAFMDSLTKLGNRNSYYELIKKINEQIQNDKRTSFAIAIFDINGLKEINDSHGHEEGDKAIKIAADTLSEAFSKENCYRIGGDELVAVYIGLDEEGIKNRMLDFDEILAEKVKTYSLKFSLTLSKGYALFDGNKDKNFASVFSRADKLMYEEKTNYYKKAETNRRK